MKRETRQKVTNIFDIIQISLGLILSVALFICFILLFIEGDQEKFGGFFLIFWVLNFLILKDRHWGETPSWHLEKERKELQERQEYHERLREDRIRRRKLKFKS